MNWYRLLILALTLSTKLGLGSIVSAELITNPYRTDGFGAQFQTIIYSIIYAELNHHTYLYSPFSSLEHNYDNDPEFIAKKEWLVNLWDYFPINQDIAIQNKISLGEYIVFFESHLNECVHSKSLKMIKNIFRLNKDRNKYFNNKNLNIAVHIRRPNQHDNRTEGSDTPDSVYANIIDVLRKKFIKKRPLFHIYSQGVKDKFSSIFSEKDIILHINDSIEDTFTSMVFADVLVTSGSSFSYTAGLLSNGKVYYMRFWHPPLPGWNEINY